jgi:hypothetical protein
MSAETWSSSLSLTLRPKVTVQVPAEGRPMLPMARLAPTGSTWRRWLRCPRRGGGTCHSPTVAPRLSNVDANMRTWFSPTDGFKSGSPSLQRQWTSGSPANLVAVALRREPSGVGSGPTSTAGAVARTLGISPPETFRQGYEEGEGIRDDHPLRGHQPRHTVQAWMVDSQLRPGLCAYTMGSSRLNASERVLGR